MRRINISNPPINSRVIKSKSNRNIGRDLIILHFSLPSSYTSEELDNYVNYIQKSINDLNEDNTRYNIKCFYSQNNDKFDISCVYPNSFNDSLKELKKVAPTKQLSRKLSILRVLEEIEDTINKHE